MGHAFKLDGHSAFRREGSRTLEGICSVCGKGPGHPVHLGLLPGMETAPEERAAILATETAEELTQRMLEPRNVNDACGRMERESPLFRFTGDNPGLF